ncbi:helix-turn-helix domain-containing protein [Spongiimicrobium salis]|uniref:hypothetical protein n=1 Tax=Spongiimicrobium salis TaxID=1667022 RepID=UPI00374D810E
MFQDILLRQLQEEIPENSSLIDAVATALQISYDAAHRRVSQKSKLSLSEGIQLAKYYHISLDRLVGHSQDQYVIVEKTKHINSEKELQAYFENSYHSLTPLLRQKESRIIYSAKDIPIFYTLSGDLLSNFKIYVWLKLLDTNLEYKSFETFVPSISLVQAGKQLGSLYHDLTTTEIWDITTINSTLKQIHFYHQAGLITTTTALALCVALKKLIDHIMVKLQSNKTAYLLYYNELLLMNNNVLVSTPQQQSLYVPFTILSYYKTNDPTTCKQAAAFLDKQLQSSKLLNTAGEKERNSFFSKIHKKVDALHELIQATQILDFQ